MQKPLSLVEMATYGYMPTRVRKGSWLEQQFGPTDKEVEEDERIGRPDQDKGQCTGR